MRIGSLFSGAGMLDEGVRAVLGGTTAWHVEFDAAASRVLVHNYPGVPNLGDVTKVDWASVEPVDVITGGFPCQDVSAAGKRAGIAEGNRSGLWTEMHKAIATLRPQVAVIENVRGLLSARTDSSRQVVTFGPKGGRKVGHTDRALGRVLADLADVGYDARWYGLRAADVGAPHGRFRVFVVAQDADGAASGERWLAAPGQEARGWAWADAGRSDRVRTAAHTAGNGWDEGWTEPAGIVGGSDAAECGAVVADSDGAGGEAFDGRSRPGNARRLQSVERRGTDWGPYTAAIERWASRLGRQAPAPTETAPRGGQRLSPRFVEWMMGWPAGWVTDVPGIPRNQQLKICGNGVVPQQAAMALQILLPGIDNERQAA